MHYFKNHKVQDLYNYLVNDFEWKDFTYNEPGVLESFGQYIESLNNEDWDYFENNINLWSSEILHRLASVIVEYDSRKMDFVFQNKIYCLALINCLDEETSDLIDNLIAHLGSGVDLDSDLLNKVLNRLNELLNNYTVVARFGNEEHIKRTIDFVKIKLNLTLDKARKND
ncbi:conserved protein of unknown function [Tenacibaculum sp. 190130A14a]|uniref:Uncharacterized protein n=1 Tax=Tenacibaculum polynesiense TaxID=3137857 RepID=A0ABP1EZR5_9FLAO